MAEGKTKVADQRRQNSTGYARSDRSPGNDAGAGGRAAGRVSSLAERRRQAARHSGGGHNLQLRLPAAVYDLFLILMERAEAESAGELVRTALRAYERALHEYDAIQHADGQIVELTSAGGRSVVEVGTQDASSQPRRRDVQAAGKTRRVNVPLSAPGYARLKRLAELTGARSLADVVRTAFCVLDYELDEYDRIVGTRQATADCGEELALVPPCVPAT